MLNALAKDLIVTFIATSMTFAAIQLALPDTADSYPVSCHTTKCSGIIPPVSYEVKQKYQSSHEATEERQAELEEMATIEAEENGMYHSEDSDNDVTPRLK